MNYKAFLVNRGSHFRRIAAKLGDGVVCTTTFGAIDLTSHVWGLAQGRLDQKLVQDIGGYGVMHDHCEIEPLVEFLWKVSRWKELRLVVQYVKDFQGRTFICVQRGSHGWYAIARINRPDNPMLLKEFFSIRRAHDKEGFGFCASKGAPQRIYNYRPDLLDRQAIVEMYGYWLRWAERTIGNSALHFGAWEEDVKHGIGKKKSDISRLRKSAESGIVDRPLTQLVMMDNGEIDRTPLQLGKPVENQIPVGMSLHESIEWYRDGYELLVNIKLNNLKKDGKVETARDLLEKLIVVVSDKPESLAECYMKLGIVNEVLINYERASEAYRQALGLEPKERAVWYYAHNNLGFCLNEMHQHGEAETYLRQAIEIEPGWYNAYKNLGVALAAQGEYAEAAKLFVRATILSPYDPRALNHLEELLDEHELVYLQVPEIRGDLEECQRLVREKEPGFEGLRRISPPAMAEMTIPSSEGAQKKLKTIAILDDEPVFLEVLGNELANEGYEVLTCADKRTFLRKLPKLSVDLVISDIHSPGMSGLQLLTEMKRDKKTKNIPVIIISGSVGRDLANDRLQGVYEALSKPYKVEELLVVVKRALDKERLDSDLSD